MEKHGENSMDRLGGHDCIYSGAVPKHRSCIVTIMQDGEMTGIEFDAAADLTKVGKVARAGSYMVLIGGKTPAQAGREVDTSRQTIHAAVKTIRQAHEAMIAPDGCRLVKAWLPCDEADEVEQRCRKRKAEETQ